MLVNDSSEESCQDDYKFHKPLFDDLVKVNVVMFVESHNQ